MIFSKNNGLKKDLVFQIYQNIVQRSRSKFFYITMEIEDNFECRFDIIIMHSFLIFYYFKELKGKNDQLSQLLFDHMFSDFDNNLREMGFGDIAVNKKMKVFISAFYGRISQYSKGINEAMYKNNYETLDKAIQNNLYKGETKKVDYINFLRDYIINNIKYFQSKSENSNLEEKFKFIELPKEAN